MNIRIQTYGKRADIPIYTVKNEHEENRTNTHSEGTAIEALEKGLRDLQDLCDVVGEKFWDARNEYAAATVEA